VTTANSNASSDAHKLLAYLTSLKGKPGKHVISGQNIGGDGIGQFAPNLVHYVEELHTQTGKWVALAGFGLGYPDLQSAVDMQTTRKYAADWWKTGGLVTMWASPGNPQTGGNAQDNNFSGARQLITPGNPLNDKWKAILDRIATALAGLQDDGVVVLWRPLHEMNGNWFWWSMDNGVNMAAADFIAISAPVSPPRGAPTAISTTRSSSTRSTPSTATLRSSCTGAAGRAPMWPSSTTRTPPVS
jgi:mannan endo-1,4-beta-mannosidase